MTDGRTERAERLRRERRAQILDAALKVFADKGYHHASITQLVKAAGVARGTFYLYFDSKNAIFLALLDDLLQRFRGSVKGVDVSPDAPPVEEQLVQTVVRILEAAASSRALATIVFREAVGLDEDVDTRVRAFEEALHGYIVDALTRGRDLGLLREHDPDVAAACIYGSIRQVIERWMVVGVGEVDTEHLAREVVAHHVRGLLAFEL